MVDIKIVGVDSQDEAGCIVCGDATKHRHSYSNAPLKQVPVCKKCCQSGCNGIHRQVQTSTKVYHCNRCNVDVPKDKSGMLLDNVYICPTCQEKLVPK